MRYMLPSQQLSNCPWHRWETLLSTHSRKHTPSSSTALKHPGLVLCLSSPGTGCGWVFVPLFLPGGRTDLLERPAARWSNYVVVEKHSIPDVV